MAKKIWIFGLDFGAFLGVPGPRDPRQELRLVFLHRMDRFSALEMGFGPPKMQTEISKK